MRKPAEDKQVSVLFITDQHWKWLHRSPPAATLKGELENTNHAQTELKIL